jgi:hypothetical protein
MRTPKNLFPTLALMIAGLSLTGAAAAVEVPIEKSAEVQALPAAVHKTVMAEGVGATVRGVMTEKGADSVLVYEVEMRIKGLTKDIVVGADGTLLVNEQQMTMAALPPAVRKTIVKSAGKRKILMVESVTKLGKLEFYEAHVGSIKSPTEIKVAADGALLPPE